MHELIEELQKKMANSYEIFLVGIKGIRTGKAHTSLLDGVFVSTDSGKFKINHVSTVSVVGPKTLSVNVWDPSNVSDVKNAILSSGLGLNPIIEGSVVRLVIPDLSEESRKSYVGTVKKQTEDARVVMRNIARDCIAKFRSMEKAKEISEDECKRYDDEIQKLRDEKLKEIDAASEAKQYDIMSA